MIRNVVMAAVAAAALAGPATADVMGARQELGAIFKALNCYATEAELRSESAKSGVSRTDMVAALRMMRTDGVIGTTRVDGVPVVTLRDEAGCGGPRFEQFRQILGEDPGPQTRPAMDSAIDTFASQGCVATRADVIADGAARGFSAPTMTTALVLLGGSLETIRMPDGRNYGMRLSGNPPSCP